MFHILVNTKEFRVCNNNVHKFTQHFVEKALKASPEELEKHSENGYTFLYELAKQTRDPQVIQDQILNILLAGRDTTAGTLSFIFFELSRNPRVFEKLKEEIYNTFGKGDDAAIEEITFESLKKCEYLKFVINETLRLYPAVPVNFRVATRDTTLPRGGGPDGQSPLYVAKNTTVAYSVYCTHRLEEFYGKDALEFRPERWAELLKLGWAYVPFNGGPRICLGQQFALTEISYVVTRLLQMFPNLENRDDAPYPPKKAVHLTMCHQDGVFISLTE
jgi:cytochrome P450